jgi:hypothetical protein
LYARWRTRVPWNGEHLEDWGARFASPPGLNEKMKNDGG